MRPLFNNRKNSKDLNLLVVIIQGSLFDSIEQNPIALIKESNNLTKDIHISLVMDNLAKGSSKAI